MVGVDSLLSSVETGFGEFGLFPLFNEGALWTVLANVGGLEVTGLAMLFDGALSF